MNHRLALILGALCVAFSPIFTKLSGVPGLSSSYYRSVIGLILFLPYIIYTKQYKLQVSSAIKCMLCGVLFSIDLSCWNQSLMLIETAPATVLGNMAPVWAGFMFWAVTKEVPKFWYWIGLIISMMGLVVMIGWDNIKALNFSWGSILAILASIIYAAYMVATGLVRGGIPTMRFMFYSMVGYFFTSLIIMFITDAPMSGFSNLSWFYLIMLALIPQLAGWILVNHALGSLKSIEVSLTMLVQIPIACVVGAFLFKEKITAEQIIGGSLILLGIVFTYFDKMRAGMKRFWEKRKIV